MSGPADFDPLEDPTLSRGLGALAPSEFDLDADAALGSMRPALHRARARRRLAISSSALGVVVVLAAGAVVLQEKPTSRVDIRGGTTSTVETPTSTSRTKPTTSTTKPRVVVPPTSPNRSTTTVRGGDRGGSTPGSTPTSASTPNTDDHGGTTPTTPSTVAAPVTKTYSAPGGRLTVRFANGRLTLVSHTAAPGYTTEIHTNKPDDIELRFSNGSVESRIRVRVQDGRLQPEITEN